MLKASLIAVASALLIAAPAMAQTMDFPRFEEDGMYELFYDSGDCDEGCF
jgi:hypothetical protein